MLTAGTTSYLYGPGGLPIETIDSTGTPTYLFHDQLGSTRLLASQAGTVTGTYTYDAWGNTTSHTGTATTPVRYGGQYQDDETGLYYLRSRYYDPVTAQFLTTDPLLSQTRATYTYAGNNPATSTDPSGLMCVPGMSANANCNDHPVQNPHNGGDPTGSGPQPVPSGSRCIPAPRGMPMPPGDCLHASDFLTPSQGQALFVILGLTFVNILQAGLDPATDSAEAGAIAAEETGAAADAAGSTTRVGRWMSQNEFDQMSSEGRVQEGAGGRTYVSNPANPDAWKGAAPGSIYSEFDVPTSSLFRAGNPGWGVIPGPNVTTGIYGPPPFEMPYATNIEWLFAK